MKRITNNVYLKVPILLTFLILSLSAISQNGTANTLNVNKCTTFVYNLSTEEMKIRDICFEIFNKDHIDLNKFSTGAYDRTKDFWKFLINIIDNEKLIKSSINASFYVYENSPEIIQYHCDVTDADIKAIIFDKVKNSWQILIFQNEDYKLLSSYSGYHYTNAFGIKSKTKSNIDY